MAPFTMHVIRGDETAQVVVFGALRGPEAPKVAGCLIALAERGCNELIVDLSSVTSMDAGACASLIDAIAQLEEGGAFLFVSFPHSLRRLTDDHFGHGRRHRSRLGGAVLRQARIRR